MLLFVRIALALIAAAGISAVAQQNTGSLKTKITPGSAGVFVDGKYVGPASSFGIGRKYTIAAGEHEIRLADPRYEEYVTKVTIEPGKTTTLSQTLKPAPRPSPPFGVLRTISADKFAAVYVNGRYMGHADEFNNPWQGLQLNPGEYIVKIARAGSDQGREEKIRIEADRVTIVRDGQ